MKQKIVRVLRQNIPQKYAHAFEATYRQNVAKLVSYRGGASIHKLRVFVIVGSVGKRTTAVFLEKMLRSCGRTVASLYSSSERPLEPRRVQSFLKQSKKDNIECAILSLNYNDLRLCSLGTVIPEVAIICPTYTATVRDQRMLAYFLKENPSEHILYPEHDEAISTILEQEDIGHGTTYGVGETADIQARDIVQFAKGTQFTLVADTQTTIELATHLIGAYNVENCLAAFGASYITGENIEDTVEGIIGLEEVPGNLQRIESGAFTTYLDAGLSQQHFHRLIDVVLPIKKSRIIVVASHKLLTEKVILRLNRDAARCMIFGKHPSASRSVNAQTFDQKEAALMRAIDSCLPNDILLVVGEEFSEIPSGDDRTLLEKILQKK